jgi:hypothetical protein
MRNEQTNDPGNIGGDSIDSWNVCYPAYRKGKYDT